MPNRGFALLGFLGLCLLVELSAAGFSAGSVRGWYAGLAHPPGTPPDWLFAPVWTVLYTLMAVSAWLVWRCRRPAGYRALQVWGWQLLVNALWSPAFFGLNSVALGLAMLLPLPPLVALTAWRFAPVSRTAAVLLLPYLAWSVYAAALATGFFLLNHR